MKLLHFVQRFVWKIFPTFAINKRVDSYIKNKYHDKIWGGYKLDEQIEENIHIFLTEKELEDKKFLESIKRDIVKSYLLYGVNANEYFTHNFYRKKHKERNRYMSKKRKDELLIRTVGEKWEEAFLTLKDKNKFYQMAKDFFLRNVVSVENKSDLNEFLHFAGKNPKFITKPSRNSCGQGIKIVDLSVNPPTQVFDDMLKEGTYICEELISQDSRLALFNESSVNTIRVPSIWDGTKACIFYPVLRTGRKGNVVDNAGSGGIFALVDADTGMVISDGYDELGHHFVEHPDSYITYKGFQIPEWDNLKSVVNKIHSTMPKEFKYVGWDFTLSNKGWCVIEANWGDFIMQQKTLDRGLYKEFKQILLK